MRSFIRQLKFGDKPNSVTQIVTDQRLESAECNNNDDNTLNTPVENEIIPSSESEPTESNNSTSNFPIQNESIPRPISKTRGEIMLSEFSNDICIIRFTGLPSVSHFLKLCEAAEIAAVDINLKNFPIEERVLLTLMKFKLNLTCSSLAALFGLKPTVCIQYIFITIDLLYLVLKNLIIWPSKMAIMNSMPIHFIRFPHTRIILDCTEIPVMKMNCLNCRIRTYSHYKGCHTVKFMAGVTPCGIFSFVSSTYGGRASDKFIFNDSKVIEKCELGDGIMVDKGFPIEQECNVAGMDLLRPNFLTKDRFTTEESDHNRYVSRARVHVERAFQRVKNFRILKDQLHHMFLEVIDEIVVIICALVNLSKPILKSSSFLDNV